jgi:hypothetical protein
MDSNNNINDDVWNDEEYNDNDIVMASNDISVMSSLMQQSGYRQGINPNHLYSHQ